MGEKMDGCSNSKDCFFLENDEGNQAHESCKFRCFDLDFSEEDDVFGYRKGKLKSWFDQIIPIYLREVYVDKCFRPLPVLVGDGQPVDLFNLFWVVKNRGGFRTVSEYGLWDLVADECGLLAELIASIKLVYINYLKELDGWLWKVFMSNRSENGEIEIFKKLDRLIMEAKELKGLVWSKQGKKRCGRKQEVRFDANGGSVDIDSGKSKSCLSNGRVFNMVHDNTENNFDEAEGCADFGTWKSELLLCDGRGKFNKVRDNAESSNANKKDICIHGNKSIMFSAKCIVGNCSQENEFFSEAEVDKAQDSVETSRSDYDNEKPGVQDNSNILLPGRSVVHEVISSMRSECCSLAEGENMQENATNTYDNDEKRTDDYEKSLSAKRIADKFVYSRNKGMNLCSREGTSKVHEHVESVECDYGKVHVQDEANVISSSMSIGNNLLSSRKRKWKPTSLSGMLDWVTQVAKRTDDPEVGVIPAPSTWKDCGTEAYWMQALLARDALLVRKPVYEDSEECSLQKKLKMNPSIHEDKNALHQTTEIVGCSNQLPFIESQHCLSCNSGPATPNKVTSPCKADTENDRKVPSSPMTEDVSSTAALDASPEEDAPVRHVSVGPLSQAEVPEWTGVALESDSKWLGKRMWPLDDEKRNAPLDKHRIGKGRQTSCDCSFPGSTGCFGFHIAEERLRLKLALGPLFYRWKFDRMGEEVSLSWTTDEEKRFKNMVIHGDTGLNKFWNNAFRLFPDRTREKLVSYYFNVLVLRRRIYQNRVAPKNIDSDDDETEFGSIGDSAYFDGKYTPESDLPTCSLNTHVADLE